MEPKKFLKDNEKHGRDTHYRWLEKYPIRRNMMSADAKEEWTMQQCFTCQFYIKLEGMFGASWGVCSNKSSPIDGKITFEHDGCDFFSFAEDEERF